MLFARDQQGVKVTQKLEDQMGLQTKEATGEDAEKADYQQVAPKTQTTLSVTVK